MFYYASKKNKSSWLDRFKKSVIKKRHIEILKKEKREQAEGVKIMKNVGFFRGDE